LTATTAGAGFAEADLHRLGPGGRLAV